MSAAPAVHRTLGRQLRRLGLQAGSAPSAAAWAELLEAVSTAYGEADDERYTLERSIEVSSREMRGLHEVLSRRALQDPLTGLPNRAALLADLDTRLAGGAGRRDVAVLFIDLDGFKKVNDGLGHAAGDELLVRAAERIRSCLRPTDVVARLGGDEFVVVCDGGAAVAAAVARRIGTELAAPFRVAEQDASISGSIGLATTGEGPDGRDGPEDLLRRADLAMYDAKVSGRARTSVFDASMESGASSRAALRAELSAALGRDELRLVHQPVVDLADGRLVGLEALVRWSRPGGEVLAPDEFLPAAEEGSLVAEVDRWVVTEALERGAAWCRAGGRISVNASCRSLEGDALVGAVGAALQRTGVPARSLLLEVPEAALAGSHRAADRALEHLRAMGVGIALDGFGTGTSSLAQLQHPRVDVVKVAPALVARVDVDPVAAAAVGAVVSVARASGLTVVAVGVERQAQADLLRAQGCHQAQGWLFGRPEEEAEGLG